MYYLKHFCVLKLGTVGIIGTLFIEMNSAFKKDLLNIDDSIDSWLF